MLSSYSCVLPLPLRSTTSPYTSFRQLIPGQAPGKSLRRVSKQAKLCHPSRSLCTPSRHELGSPVTFGYSKKRKISNELKQLIREDSKTGAITLPSTGPNSGSRNARHSREGSTKYPDHFLQQTISIEAESKAHLEEIRRHFVDVLDLHFDDWELVQAALTHYSCMGARRTNDALSRLGEKVLRFILLTEIQNLEPQASKQAWFLQTNLRFLTRFEFLATYIESTLQLERLTKSREPTEAAAKRNAIQGKDALQYKHSVVAKSVLALIGVIYKTMGESQARIIIRTLFIDPYKDETGKFQAPVLQPMQIRQTGGL